MNEIAQLVSGDSEDVFHDRMEQLLMIKQMWEKNINFTLKPIESSNVEDKVTPDDISTYNAIEINDDKSIDEPISIDEPKSVDIETEILDENVEKISLASTELAKDVPKRGAPTLKERKRKAKANTITTQRSKSIKVNDDSELKEFFTQILLDEFKPSVDSFISKERVVDEEHIQVIPSKINPSVLSCAFVNENNEISSLVSSFFTSDALLMLQNTLSALRSHGQLNSCNSCSLSCDSKFIVCSSCNNYFHLKCVKKAYAPKIKKWLCANCNSN